jgi:hypothetical protein
MGVIFGGEGDRTFIRYTCDGNHGPGEAPMAESDGEESIITWKERMAAEGWSDRRAGIDWAYDEVLCPECAREKVLMPRQLDPTFGSAIARAGYQYGRSAYFRGRGASWTSLMLPLNLWKDVDALALADDITDDERKLYADMARAGWLDAMADQLQFVKISSQPRSR